MRFDDIPACMTLRFCAETFPGKEGGPSDPPYFSPSTVVLLFNYIDCLRSFGSLFDIERHLLTLGKRLKTISHDRGMMYKNIASILGRNKSESL